VRRPLAIARWLFLAALLLQTIPFALGAQIIGDRLLAAAELVAIVLVAVGRTRLAGTLLLLAVFLAAAAWHLAHGQHPVALMHPALLAVTLEIAERRRDERP
jgi:hypothetical protein